MYFKLMYFFTVLRFDVFICFMILFICGFIYGLQTNLLIPILNCAIAFN